MWRAIARGSLATLAAKTPLQHKVSGVQALFTQQTAARSFSMLTGGLRPQLPGAGAQGSQSLLAASIAARMTPNSALIPSGVPSDLPLLAFSVGQRRFKARGNTYQPSWRKRKRSLGFISRVRSRTGRVIINRRRAKGRWRLAP